MDFFAAISSSLISIIFFCMIVAGVLKLFQIGTLLTEIKDLLQSQRHLNNVPPAPATPAPHEWTTAASRTAASADYPAYSARSNDSAVLEAVPQVVRAQVVHEPQVVPTHAHLAPSGGGYPTHQQEAVPPPLDKKMSGEEMLRALDLELRAEETRRASNLDDPRGSSAAPRTTIDTTIVTPHE